MADSKVTFLMEVELPPYCFMSEAIEWIAFGRVPQMQHHLTDKLNEMIDYRFSWKDMPDNFQPTFEHPWFDPLEFESLAIPLPEGYAEAAENCFMEDADNLSTRIAEYEAKDNIFVEHDDGSTINFYQKLAGDCRQTLAGLREQMILVDEVRSRFQPHFEVACAKLFQLVAVGEIGAQAINMERWERLVDEDEIEKAATFKDVPSRAFSLNLDWPENEIVVDGINHVALRVKTQDILDHRAILLQPGKPVEVERFGAFYLSSNLGRTNRRKKRGRRSIVDWQTLKDHLSKIARSEMLPEGKENCIYELIVFAEKELGKAPSRTAVQRNMGAELDALYAQN